MTATVSQIRVLVAEITGLDRVYAASENDDNGIPAALNQFPCALVLPGPDKTYILSAGQHRHEYEVRVQIFQGGPSLKERAYSVLPLVDAIIEKFTANVTLGNRANSSIYKRQSGMVTLTYGGIDYLGVEVILDVSEQAAATPATGS